MSLTSIIRSDAELRRKIILSFARPKLDKKISIISEPLTKNSSLVGTAFDYLLRFQLEAVNKDKIINTQKPWVAEQAVDRLGFNPKLHQDGQDIVDKVKNLKIDFLKTGIMSEEIIRHTLRMSYLDPIFRAGTGLELIGLDAENLDVADIQSQFNGIDLNQFIAKNSLILNPTFGIASARVGGADADVICDDKLIDIKTTKNLALNINDFCQLIGYYTLHRIGSVDGAPDITINNLGIYYSRYKYLFMFNVHDLIDESSLDDFIKWFDSRFGVTKNQRNKQSAIASAI